MHWLATMYLNATLNNATMLYTNQSFFYYVYSTHTIDLRFCIRNTFIIIVLNLAVF